MKYEIKQLDFKKNEVYWSANTIYGCYDIESITNAHDLSRISLRLTISISGHERELATTSNLVKAICKANEHHQSTLKNWLKEVVE